MGRQLCNKAYKTKRTPAQGNPNNEIIDILSPKGRVIGKGKYGDVHSKGLWHRCAYVIPFNKNNDVLLQVRSVKKDDFPGCYDVVSEHVLSKESTIAAARRGLIKEVGVKGTDLTFFIQFKGEHSTAEKLFSTAYTCTIPEDIKIDRAEVTKAEFMSLGNIATLLIRHPEKFASWAFEILRYMLDMQGNDKIIK